DGPQPARAACPGQHDRPGGAHLPRRGDSPLAGPRPGARQAGRAKGARRPRLGKPTSATSRSGVSSELSPRPSSRGVGARRAIAPGQCAPPASRRFEWLARLGEIVRGGTKMGCSATNAVDRMMLAAGRVALVAGLSLPLALATASFAQPAAQTPRSAPPAAADHHHGGYRHHDRGDHEETAAARADRLRTLLQLRSDQEPALSAFVASTAPGAGPQPEDVDAERALPAPERMERMLARMDAVRAQMGQKLAALKTFYAQLTPSQQKAF